MVAGIVGYRHGRQRRKWYKKRKDKESVKQRGGMIGRKGKRMEIKRESE